MKTAIQISALTLASTRATKVAQSRHNDAFDLTQVRHPDLWDELADKGRAKKQKLVSSDELYDLFSQEAYLEQVEKMKKPEGVKHGHYVDGKVLFHTHGGGGVQHDHDHDHDHVEHHEQGQYDLPGVGYDHEHNHEYRHEQQDHDHNHGYEEDLEDDKKFSHTHSMDEHKLIHAHTKGDKEHDHYKQKTNYEDMLDQEHGHINSKGEIDVHFHETGDMPHKHIEHKPIKKPKYEPEKEEHDHDEHDHDHYHDHDHHKAPYNDDPYYNPSSTDYEQDHDYDSHKHNLDHYHDGPEPLHPFHKHGDGINDEEEDEHYKLHSKRREDYDYYAVNYHRTLEKPDYMLYERAYDYDHHSHDDMDYDHDYDQDHHVPDDFYESVADFDPWEPIFQQDDYEERIEVEAELMIGLEALREAVIVLNGDVKALEECHDDNEHNLEHIWETIEYYKSDVLAHELEHQQYRVKQLQDRCRASQTALDIDREALVLFCQQYAFAQDMVGPCARLLTCRDTELEYRWNPWEDHLY